MKRNYTKQFGKTQEEIYKIMRDRGSPETYIQEMYKIPQASLRRCRHRYNTGKI